MMSRRRISRSTSPRITFTTSYRSFKRSTAPSRSRTRTSSTTFSHYGTNGTVYHGQRLFSFASKNSCLIRLRVICCSYRK